MLTIILIELDMFYTLLFTPTCCQMMFSKNIIQTHWNPLIKFAICCRFVSFLLTELHLPNFKVRKWKCAVWLKIGSLKTFHWPLPKPLETKKGTHPIWRQYDPPKHVHVGRFKHKILKITCYLCTWMSTDRRILWVIKEWMALIDDIKPVYTLEV